MSIRRTPENTFERPEELETPPAAPRSLRRTVGVVRPDIKPSRARGAPGRFGPDYEPMVLEHPRSRRPNRAKRNHAVAGYTAVTLALLAAGAAADRFIQSSNHPAAVAAELKHSAPEAAQELIDHGADGVVLVPVSDGEKVSTITNQIANSAGTDEVAEILEDQQGGSDVISGNTLAALPAADLTTSALRKLPDHGQVTAQGLAELQGGSTIQ